MMKKTNKTSIIIAVAVLLLIAGTIIVFAALRDTSGTVTEEFEKPEVTCEVNDDYTVTNTSDIPALIRVRVVVNNTDGGDIIPGETPDYTVGSDWTQIGDYIYYNGILTEKDGDSDTTSAAISIDQGDAQVIVLAEAIQAASDASKEGWDATYLDGSWS